MIRGVEEDSGDMNVAWIRYRVGIRSLCKGAPHIAYEQIQKLSPMVSVFLEKRKGREERERSKGESCQFHIRPH